MNPLNFKTYYKDTIELNTLFLNKAYLRSSNLKLKTSCNLLDFKTTLLPTFGNFAAGSSINVKRMYVSKKIVGVSSSLNWLIANSISKEFSCKKLLKAIQHFDKNLSTLLVLKPIKGGYICYSSGLFGFMPRMHGKFLILKLLKSFQKIYFNNVDSTKSTLQLLKTFGNFYLNKFLFRFRIFCFKVSFSYRYTKKTYSLKLNRRRKKSNRFNIVFLTKLKFPLKPISNEKFKKDIRH